MEFVRVARASDVKRVSQLYEECIAANGAARGGAMFSVREAFAGPYDTVVENFLIRKDACVFVGGIDDVTLGFAMIHREVLRSDDVHGVIDALYVEPDARAVGIGEALMEALVNWAREEDVTTIDAHALPGDRETKNFFEMSGFVARLITMHHKVEPQSDEA